MANCTCMKCGRTFDEKNFYTYKTGQKCDLCKACLTMHVNVFQPDTFLWILEKFNIPYVEAEWNSVRDKAYQKNPYNMSSASVLGKYFSKMRLNQYGKKGWADSDELNSHMKEVLAEQNSEEKIQEMKDAFEQGIISEAQWLTYQQKVQPAETTFINDGGIITTSGGNGPIPVMAGSNFVSVEIPDIGLELTEEDKLYLATKWGTSYTAADWVNLEKMYNEYDESFDLHNADLTNGTRRLCKLILRADQALDCGDADSHSKYERAADTLRKSLKFTEAQRKDDLTTDFSCYGQLVDYAEKTKGAIPPIDLKVQRDIVDKDLQDIKDFNRSIVEEDTAVFRMIEEYIKKRNILAEQKQREEEAGGNENITITDADLMEFMQHEEEQKE